LGTSSYQQEFSCFSESNLTPLGDRSGITQGLHDIFQFKVWIIREEFFNAYSFANLSNNHADSYAHTANTGLPAHDVRVLGNTVKIFKRHRITLA